MYQNSNIKLNSSAVYYGQQTPKEIDTAKEKRKEWLTYIIFIWYIKIYTDRQAEKHIGSKVIQQHKANNFKYRN